MPAAQLPTAPCAGQKEAANRLKIRAGAQLLMEAHQRSKSPLSERQAPFALEGMADDGRRPARGATAQRVHLEKAYIAGTPPGQMIRQAEALDPSPDDDDIGCLFHARTSTHLKVIIPRMASHANYLKAV
jgi:hypothetical protein